MTATPDGRSAAKELQLILTDGVPCSGQTCAPQRRLRQPAP